MSTFLTADPDTRIIDITKVPVAGLSDLDVAVDIYSDLKEDWLSTPSLQPLRFPFRSFGDPKTPQQAIGPYVFIDNGSGWRIRAYDVDHELTINGNIVPEDVTLPVWLPRSGRSILILEEQSAQALTTIAQLADIVHAAYDGGVHVDVTGTQTGTEEGSGNSANPVNNWADAVVINAREGFDKYFVEKSTTLDVAENYDFAKFEGRSVISTVLSIPAGASIDKAEFFFVSLEGALGDTTMIRDCFLGETNSVENVRGRIERSSIGPAPVILGGDPSTTVYFTDCRGAGEDVSPVTISGNGNGPKLDMQNHTGTLTLVNKTGDAFWDIQINADVRIDSTCTGGIIRIIGAGKTTDNSGADCLVITDGQLDPTQVKELWKNEGLEFNNPLTLIKNTSRATADGAIDLALTGDGINTTTVTRQTDQTITLDIPLTSDLLDDSDTGATPTFTRASTGTYLNPTTGLLTTAAIDEPRFEGNGLLRESESENICLQSEDFTTTWLNTFGSVTANQAVAPDGQMTADLHIDDNLGGATAVMLSQLVTVATSTQYCASVFLKADQLSFAFFEFDGFTTPAQNTRAYFNLSAGSVGTVSANIDKTFIKDFGNGWYRCSTVITTDASDTAGFVRVGVSAADNNNVVDRDGTSSIFVWGGQMEAGAKPTSYISTTIASVARSADFLSYAQDAVIVDALGSCIAEFTPLGDEVVDANLINVADQLVGPLYLVDDTVQKSAAGDGTTVSSVAMPLTANTLSKIASRWSAADNELQSISDGVAATAVAYDGAFTRTGTLFIGSDSTGNHADGNIRNVKVYRVDKGEDQLKVDTG